MACFYGDLEQNVVFFKKIKNVSQSNIAIATFLFFSKIHDFSQSNIALRGNFISSRKVVHRLNTDHKIFFILLIFSQTALRNWHKKCKNSVFHNFYEISHFKSCLSTRVVSPVNHPKIDFLEKTYFKVVFFSRKTFKNLWSTSWLETYSFDDFAFKKEMKKWVWISYCPGEAMIT